MTREEAIKWLKLLKTSPLIYGEYPEAIDITIEALSAEEAVWNEYEAEFTDLPDIPRYYYEKVVGKMAHEINMLKEQLESAEYEDYEHATLVDIKEPLKVSVVRCKDCRHYHKSEMYSYCSIINVKGRSPKEIDFCSCGERREK